MQIDAEARSADTMCRRYAALNFYQIENHRLSPVAKEMAALRA